MTATLLVDLLAQRGETADSIEDVIGVAQTILELAGTVAFAISAALVAGHKRMNFAGVVVFGVIVAVGGGTLRDLLLGNLPVYWVDDPAPLIVAAATAALTIPLFALGTISVIQRYGLVRVLDSAGLALFVVAGTNIALDSGAGAVSAVVVGVISGIGGGMIRDSLAEKVPQVLASGHFYASAAVTGSALNIALLETSIRPVFASTIAVLYIFTVRLLSIHYGWGIPKFRIDDGDQDAGPATDGT
jgi:uncharacterized membrane protein YeiH